MPAILETQNLCKAFGAVTAAQGISVAVERDSVVGLVGTNGAGKTTFVNLVTGYLKPSAGAILFKGRNITELHPRDITRLGICRSFQIPQLYESQTMFENLVVAFGIAERNARGSILSRTFKLVPGYNPRVVAAVEAMLKRFGLAEYAEKPVRLLPEGIRKLLDIAMALVGEPEVLIMDEPTSGVSADEKFGIMDMIMNAVRARGVTVLFVEHDMDIVSRYAQRVIAFYEGRVLADGPTESVLRHADVQRYVVGGTYTLRGPTAEIADA